jgi:long-chain fatty acid transport protein
MSEFYRKRYCAAVAGFCLLLCTVSFAGEGVFLLGNDALQLGRASSGVASPRSAYWSYMNPASMVDLDRRLDVNWYTVFSDVTFEPRGIMGNRLDGKLESDKIFNIVSTGMIWPLESGTLGGGVFIPSGSGVEYPASRNIFSRIFQSNHDRRLSYQHIRGVIAYAHEFDNGWSLGLGLHLSLSRFRSDHITLRLAPAQYRNQWDEAYGAGLGIGIYRSWERFSIGANYSSRHWTERMNKYRDLLSYTLDTPRVAQAGVAYKILPNLEMTLDYKWLNWKKIGTYGDPIFGGGGFGWKDQHGVKAGIEWVVHPKWTFMAGYAYSNTPITDDNVFLAALVPVTIEHHITAGVSHKINEKHEVHLVGIFAPKNKMRDTGRGDLFSRLGKGSTLEAGGMSAILGYSYLW